MLLRLQLLLSPSQAVCMIHLFSFWISSGYVPGATHALTVDIAAPSMPPKRPPPGECRFESDCPAFHRCVKTLNGENGRCVSEVTNIPHDGMITHDQPFHPHHDRLCMPPPPTVVTVVPCSGWPKTGRQLQDVMAIITMLRASCFTD